MEDVEAEATQNVCGEPLEPENRFKKLRLVAFLTLHFLAFFANVLAMVWFAHTGDTKFVCSLLVPFLFSGSFLAHVAWHYDKPSGTEGSALARCFPLKKTRPWFLGCPPGVTIRMQSGAFIWF